MFRTFEFILVAYRLSFHPSIFCHSTQVKGYVIDMKRYIVLFFSAAAS